MLWKAPDVVWTAGVLRRSGQGHLLSGGVTGGGPRPGLDNPWLFGVNVDPAVTLTVHSPPPSLTYSQFFLPYLMPGSFSAFELLLVPSREADEAR